MDNISNSVTDGIVTVDTVELTNDWYNADSSFRPASTASNDSLPHTEEQEVTPQRSDLKLSDKQTPLLDSQSSCGMPATSAQESTNNEITGVEPTKHAQIEASNGDSAKTTEKPEPNVLEQSFTLKHLKESKTVGRDEIITLAQKGLDYDRIRAKLKEASAQNSEMAQLVEQLTGYETFIKELADARQMTVEQLIDDSSADKMVQAEGIDKAIALERLRCQREFAQSNQKKEAPPENTPIEKTPEELANTKRSTDIKEFLDFYGLNIDPQAIPKEVWLDVAAGKPLVRAYQTWENKTLRAELDQLKKNNDMREKAIGSRATAGAVQILDPIAEDWYRD